MHAAPADTNTLRIDGPEAPALLPEGEAGGSAQNLVLRAAEAFERVFGGGAHAFTLEKHLPVASGIGGGSADAAAVLRLLARARGVDIAEPALGKVALALGADIPMCLASRGARIGGIGERINPVQGLDGLIVVAVNPRQPVSTPSVFKSLGVPPGRHRTSDQAQRHDLPTADWLAAIGQSGNDLEAPARVFAPAIGEAREALTAMPGCRLARMSGSGATVFGLFEALDQAARAAKNLGARYPRWWVKTGHLF
ncbi:4-diphosphocytidyl-2-C-methyl-D-erythritol kinase [hydrothermal vent metagenome]|uniref:4-(cytidine 5'-diphospho)-2-C-methyl-D-erythritol kinase n=1 Tax=hydrothermal vent metagenome TaxID=652676 RepID=A0A3B0SWT6_9ZZZZ